MRIAVLTLTRDRLVYTQHCFQTLWDNAGCDFDWYVLDQGSTDGTAEWLLGDEALDVTILEQNIGICRGLNLLLDEAVNADDYDAVVRFDNDCEVLQPDTLRVVCEAAVEHDAILAPRVQGLRNPPPTLAYTKLGGHRIDEVHHLGGIFMAVPARAFRDFRYDERQPLWTGDELICPWWTARGGRCGYLAGYAVNHYLTTDGQAADIPAYFERRVLEGGPAR